MDSFKTIQLPVLVVVGPVCSTALDGRRVNLLVQSLLNQGYSILLDFQGVKLVTPSFYQAAVGDLLTIFPEDRIQAENLPKV